jgi:uncharacterized protein YutE (UPF0331/DUF86 family)
MNPSSIDRKVVTQRASWVLEALEALEDLPLRDRAEFLRNRHNVAAAESYLRRSLEALFDIGRHILARKYGLPVVEYKEIAKRLFEKSVLSADEAEWMRKMAGYRNRMVHFYHEVSAEELHEICLNRLGEIRTLLRRMLESIG